MTTPPADWAEMPFFLAAARAGSLRAAAEALGATHATVDRHLSAMESRLGVRLFERSRAGLVLTDAGEELLPVAEAAETSVIAARRKLVGLDRQPRGTVRLSVSPSFAFGLLPPMLARFSMAQPEIDVDVVVTNRFEDLAKDADVSIRVAHEVEDDVVGRRLVRYAKAIYASQEYLDRVGRWGPEGEGLTWIGWGDATSTPSWVLSSPFPKADVRHTAREGAFVARLVASGMGLSYLPCWAEATYPELVQVPGTRTELDRSIWLLLHADLARTARVRLLVDHLAAEVKSMRRLFMGELA